MFAGHKLRRRSWFDLNFRYQSRIADTADLSTYTFAGRNFGTEHPYRMCVVGVTCYAPFNRSIDSVTIDGEATTLITAGTGINPTAIAYVKIPTGTNFDIVVTLSGSASNCRVFNYAFNTYATSALDSGTAINATAATDLSVANIECQAGGCVIAVVRAAASGGITSSWNGTDTAVEDNTGALEGAGTYWCGSVLTTEQSTTNDYTLTSVSGTGMSAVASFGFTA